MGVPIVIFLFLWLLGWSLGGGFAWFILLNSLDVTLLVIWVTVTCALIRNACDLSDCHGVRELLLCWFGLVPFLLALRLVVLKQFRSRAYMVPECGLLKQFRSRARIWSQNVRRRLLYARYHASRCIRGGRDSDYQALDSDIGIVCVTVQAVSGANILTDFKVLSQDYVHVVKDATLRALGTSGTRCQLISQNTILEDNQRLAQVGVKNGSQLLCVLTPEPVEELNPLPHEEERPTQKPPVAPKVFIFIWLCCWFIGEFYAVISLELVTLQCG